jgi:hypothetical protein
MQPWNTSTSQAHSTVHSRIQDLRAKSTIMRLAEVVVLALVAASSASCGEPAASHATSMPASRAKLAVAVTATADPVDPNPKVGAIFVGGQSLHTCTGSVLHSATGDLVLTAAHCMVDGVDASFVPAFTKSAEPHDFWHIDEIYLDPRWVAGQDPMADFAVARVSRGDGISVEAAVGGGFALGASPQVGTDVAVTGYAMGSGGGPIGCTARMAVREHGYPSLRCEGLVDGTSGAPWLAGNTVVGVTGGLEAGGCDESVSYAPPFDDAVKQLVARAEAGGPGDRAPSALEDDC